MRPVAQALVPVRTSSRLALAVLGLAATAAAQRPGGVHLRSWNGELGLESEYRDESSRNRNGDEFQQKEWLLRESFGLRGHGDIYHPALFDLDGGARVDFDQRDIETDPGNTQQRSDTTNVYYDAMGWVLKEKPLNGDLYARRGRIDTRQRFFPTTTATTEVEGADLRYRDLWIPSALHYEQTRYVGRGRDVLRQNDSRWKLDGNRSDGSTTLNYSLERNDIDQETYDNHYVEQLARVNAGQLFGPEGVHSVTAGANHREQNGKLDSSYDQVNAGLHLQWLPELHSDHSIAFDHTTIEGDTSMASNRDTWNATSWLRHKLYESLESGLGVRYYRSDYDEGQTERRDGNLELDYHKQVPFGYVALGYHPTIYREKETGGSSTVPVVGESHTYTSGVPLILLSTGIDPTSIVVHDALTSTIYLEPADYVLVQLGPRYRLDIPVGSRIVPGTALLVDYVYQPNPGFTYEGISQPVSLTFGFGDFATLTLEYATDRVRLIDGEVDGNFGNSERKAARAWAGRWGQSVTVEYEDFESFITSTERVRAIAMSQVDLASDKTLTNAASWYRTRFKEQDYYETGLSLSSDLQWRVTQQFMTYGRAEYHKVDFHADTGEGYQFEAGFDLMMRKNTVSLLARYSVEEFDVASDQDSLFMHFQWKRVF